eukprot:CAMPEP_0168372506 /NCGR_PEP_ID=MMETSP0228-20121227/8316_1 /TAXON_ID=133427 /ORGANISM="Protoceratium reticulatum, Strain CCCM 535 (=CCMP 1889)" /LENGTH=496 /DNA_ID=CAMNT_0008385415 /DNA_START=66 /DNA_END=1556 /DNA_ORIENTATION=-
MLRAIVALSVVVGCAAGDTCGHQCTTDKDCSGCGAAGKCSSPPAGKYPAIAATCVEAPSDAPAEPAHSVADSKWPDQWTADVRSQTYKDWSAEAAVAKGKFYYDGPGQRSRTEWKPYIDGRNALQVWIGGTGSQKSKYFVKSGPLCIYFPITDPGVGGSINIELTDWMARCDKGGNATYMGREKVDGEWADHYSCLIDYAKVNQTIVFQNWHSLGLGKTAKGAPVRVTGGNSAPDSKKGSPRLSTVWYSNFGMGAASVQPSDFEKPSWFCIPVGAQEAASFLGVNKLTGDHLAQPDFQQRLHFLPHAAPSRTDLARARRKRPRNEVAGTNFREAMMKLNRALAAERRLATKACSTYSLRELHQLQHEIFAARSPALQALYAGDRRSLPFATAAELSGAHQNHSSWSHGRPDLLPMLRDGLCHELVMMYMHHLSASAREELKSGASFTLPLLPETGLHPAPQAPRGAASAAHAAYTAQASCAVCHVTASATPVSLVV